MRAIHFRVAIRLALATLLLMLFSCAVAGLLSSELSPCVAADEALANVPSLTTATTEAPEEIPITEADREHWAFRPLVRPAVPTVASTEFADWVQNSIDSFILQRLLRSELTPAPEADRRTLIRRATLNLTGLPPTRDEINDFLADEQPDAFERLIDRLLASSAYGERFTQHWLDLVRFAETDGFEHDRVRADAWRYRDWLIAALDADLPFDEFTRLQLAGDATDATNSATGVSTNDISRSMNGKPSDALGFLTCGPDMPDINRQDERRHTFLNDLTATTGAVFLGLQIGCAQCHDHKTDPISQYDFYRLRAFFDPSFEFARDKPARLNSAPLTKSASWLMIRGDFQRPGPSVSAALPRVLQASNDQPRDARNSAALRMSLADWLTQPDQPLTTRVLASRLWQWHFGTGLTDTPGDFGLAGDSPLHAELLDWLATEIPRRGWSLKQMHRLIVTSATWKQASHLPADASPLVRERWQASLTRDSQGRLHSRGLRRRLEGEVIRDLLLAVSDQLNDRRGGPGIRPPLPPELTATLLRDQWPVSPDRADDSRRSVYLFVRRNLRYPFLEAFDRPDLSLSCPRRDVSTIAPQALTLLNSEFASTAAHKLAQRIQTEVGSSPSRQIVTLFEQTLHRPPTADELTAAQRFLELPPQSPADPKSNHHGLADLCLAILNLNELIYLD